METQLPYKMVPRFVNAVTICECNCLRCGKKWRAHKAKPPMRCAGCRSPYWQTPRKLLAGEQYAGEKAEHLARSLGHRPPQHARKRSSYSPSPRDWRPCAQ